MGCSKKDYVAIAKHIKHAPSKEAATCLIADYFQATNPRFKRGLFMRAAGVSDQEC